MFMIFSLNRPDIFSSDDIGLLKAMGLNYFNNIRPTKNEAESFIYTTEKLVSQDLKDKIPQEKGIQITDAIKELKDSLTQDTEQIKQKLESC